MTFYFSLYFCCFEWKGHFVLNVTVLLHVAWPTSTHGPLCGPLWFLFESPCTRTTRNTRYVTRCFTVTLQFLPPTPTKATIYAKRCRHLLFFSFGHAKNLGICEAMSSKKRENKGACVGCMEEPLNWDSLREAECYKWPSNAPPKDADPELRHSKWVQDRSKMRVKAPWGPSPHLF